MRTTSRRRFGRAAAWLVVALTAAAWFWWRVGRTFPPLGAARGCEVIDGDTIRVAGVGRVRYIGIDAPERGEPGYDQARRLNARLLGRGELRLAYGVARYDRYGRTLAYVYVQPASGAEVNVNEELVRAGWATTLEIPPNVAAAPAFARAEDEARRARRGLWAANHNPR